MDSLKKYILQLENDLLKPEIRQSSEKISELLADDFIEFSSSGYVYHYKKGDKIDDSTTVQNISWEIRDFSATDLSDDCILATYKVIKHNEVNEDKKYSLRSSIWKCYGGKWKMFFHQGTLTNKDYI
ncbi:nuclear transport factor 2 family protein [Clostridium fungisolvens]|uniref:DUF4440 domain-containing protein n=1 Tax=Clostridium fungisolvens TaxID=1604897 RepID=A0A6V8SJ42_9CLOT|nr:DUF4440 domain-containing protein [Clostridium fungisolvens]GFP76582.1 hypothetical protein bsdtw1_02685 [Clostridium fungisolvens]